MASCRDTQKIYLTIVAKKITKKKKKSHFVKNSMLGKKGKYRTNSNTLFQPKVDKKKRTIRN